MSKDTKKHKYHPQPMAFASSRLQTVIGQNEKRNRRIAKQEGKFYSVTDYINDCKKEGIVKSFADRAGFRCEVDVFAPGLNGEKLTSINRMLTRRAGSKVYYLQLKFELHRVFMVEGMEPYIRLKENVRLSDIN